MSISIVVTAGAEGGWRWKVLGLRGPALQGRADSAMSAFASARFAAAAVDAMARIRRRRDLGSRP